MTTQEQPTDVLKKSSPCTRNTQQIFHLVLKPFQGDLSEEIELSIWAQIGSSIKSKDLKSYNPGDSFQFSLNETDCRIRHLPCPIAKLFLFGKNAQVNQNHPEFRISINVKIKIENIDSSRLVGRIISGAVEIHNPMGGAFIDKPNWFWSSKMGNLQKFIFGRSKLQVRVQESVESGETLFSLFEFAGKTRKEKPLEQQGILWKFTTCNADPGLAEGSEVVEKLEEAVISLTEKLQSNNGNIFTIYPDTTPRDDPQSIEIYIEVAPKNGIFSTQEFFRTHLKVNLHQEVQPQNKTTWSIKTIKKDEDGFKLYNYDEIAYMLEHGHPAEVNPLYDFTITWTAKSSEKAKRSFTQPEGQSMPDLYFMGIDTEDKVPFFQDNIAWQPVQPQYRRFQDLPLCWMQLRLNDRPPEPASSTLRKKFPSITNHPMIFSAKNTLDYNKDSPTEEWSLELDHPTHYPGENPSDPSRIELLLQAKKIPEDEEKHLYTAQLSMRGVAFTLSSDKFDFLATPRTTSHALPGQKSFNEGWKKGKLTFQNSLLKEFSASERKKGIVAKIEDNRVDLSTDEPSIVCYLPNHHALIDTVSANGDNISRAQFISPQVFGKLISLKEIKNEGENTIVRFSGIDSSNEEENTVEQVYLSFKSQNFSSLFSEILADGSPIFPHKKIISQDIQEKIVTLTLEGKSDHQLDHSSLYILTIGERKTGYERETNLGLVPVNCKTISYDYRGADTPPVVLIGELDGEQTDITAIRALLPWTEGKFSVDAESFFEKNLFLFHRNLVQERSERTLAEAYGGKEYLSSTRNPVRDRFAQASKDLLDENPSLINWLEFSTIQADGAEVFSSVEHHTQEESESIIVKWKKPDGSLSTLPSSEISIEQGENNWLQYSIEQVNLSNVKPTISLKPFDQKAPSSTLNSFAPLLFNGNQLYDNTGAIRNMDPISLPDRYQNWSIEHLIINEKTYVSLSVVQDLIATGKDTQILFSCRNLLVSVSGDTQSIDDPGVFGFSSKIEHDNELVSFFPRYKKGIIYPTQIESITLNGSTPTKIKFTAVLINPESLFASKDERDPSKYKELDLVKDNINHSLNVGKVLSFTCDIENRTIELESGTFDWNFSTREDSAKSSKLQGSFHSLHGSVEEDENGLLLKNLSGAASTLGMMWDLNIDNRPLICSSTIEPAPVYSGICSYLQNNTFQIQTPDLSSLPIEMGSYVGYLATITPASGNPFSGIITNYTGSNEYHFAIFPIDENVKLRTDTEYSLKIFHYKQTQYQFHSENLTISESQPALDYDFPLSIKLDSPIPLLERDGKTADINGTIKTGGEVDLYLKYGDENKSISFTKLQDTYFCFSIADSPFYALILWKENNKNTPYLVGTLFERVSNNALSMKFNDTYPLNGQGFGMRVYTHAYRKKWRQLEYLSAILEGEHANQKIQCALTDQLVFDNLSRDIDQQSVSAIMQVSREETEIQFPIKLSYSFSSQEKNLSIKEENYYYIQPIINPGETIHSSPDFILPKHKLAIDLVPTQPASININETRFVKITSEDGLSFKRVPANLIPINLCLDQNSSIPLPKVSYRSPQLCHLKIDGYQMRIDLSSFSTILVSRDKTDELSTNFPFEQNKHWILCPVMERKGGGKLNQLSILKDGLWFKKNTNDSSEFSTELLLIFNRMNTQTENNAPEIPLYTLLSTTTSPAGNKQDDQPALNSSQIKQRILQAGASGVAIHQTIDATGRINALFIDSPFYSFLADDTSRTDNFLPYSDAHDENKIPGHLLQPDEITRWFAADWSNAYRPLPPSRNPSSENLQRSARYRSTKPEGLPQPFPEHHQPNLLISDITAFEDPATTYIIPRNKQDSARATINAQKNYFLPREINFHYGSDKPGAMFHHYLCPMTCQSDGKWILGQQTRFNLREPQQIAILGESRPAIKNVVGKKQPTSQDGVFRFALSWLDIMGKVNLTRLELSEELTPNVEAEDDNPFQFYFTQNHNNPFQVLLFLNDQLSVLQQASPTFAYAKLADKNYWPSIFLVSKQSSLALFTKTVTIKVGDHNQTINFEPYFIYKQGIISEINDNGQLRTAENHNLLNGDLICIPGAISSSEEVLFSIETKDDRSFSLVNVTAKIEVNTPFYEVKKLKDICLEDTSSSPYHVYSMTPYQKWISSDNASFGIIWLASIEIEEPEPGLNRGIGWIPTYLRPKNLIPNRPQLLSSKVAGLIHLTNPTHNQVLFFGDANSSGAIKPSLETENGRTYFTVSKQESEEVSAPVHISEGQEPKFQILKYFANGQVIKNS